MKKTLLSISFCLAAFASYGQNPVKPFELNEFYAQKISPNGKWLYGATESGEGVLLNTETGKYKAFYEKDLGCGNVLALDGTAVGQSADSNTGKAQAMIIKDDKIIDQVMFEKYWYSNIHGITADGTMAVGVVGNDGSTGGIDDVLQTYLPYVAEVDEHGECGNIIILPHPEEDFSGRVPQYSSANWISDDGKIILGQMVDYSGMYIQPIIYRQDESGEWSYFFPTESLFNPQNIDMPQYPGEFDESMEPDPLDYMTEEMQMEFIEDMDFWEGTYDEDSYPGNNLDYYMTEEEYDKYLIAYDNYVSYIYEYNDKINDYLTAFYHIIDTSVPFLQNGFALNREGTLAAFTSRQFVETGASEPETVYCIYLYDIEKGELKKIGSKYDRIIMGQVLPGNVVIGSTSSEDSPYPLCYVYEPGAEDFIPLEEYMTRNNPAVADWMRENLSFTLMASDSDSGIDPYSHSTRADGKTFVSGFGVASDDFSVFAIGLPSYLWSTQVGYQTYIFGELPFAGVDTVYGYEDSVVRVIRGGAIAVSGNVTDLTVTDLSGRRLFAVESASGIIETNLNRGIYVVTYTDANGKRMSQKVAF